MDREKTPEEIRAATDRMIRDRYAEAGRIVEEAERTPEDEDLPATRMARSVVRLVGLVNEQARALAHLDQLESENRELRGRLGISAGDDRPKLMAEAARLKNENEELFRSYSGAFERVRELENARRSALMVLGEDRSFRAVVVVTRAYDALRSVPDCGACRDVPPPTGCQRCRRGVKP